MPFLTWLLRVLFVLVLMRLLMRLFRGALVRTGAPGAPSAPKPVERIGGALVRDPQCGTFVPKGHAVVVGRGDGTHYFCSTSCRDAWMTSGGSVVEPGRS